MTRSGHDHRQRYERLLDVLQQRRAFTIDAIKSACTDEQPAFVTRLIRQLTQQGWLTVAEVGSATHYRWRDQQPGFSATDWLQQQFQGTQITQTPQDERPRERLINLGADQLRTAELLAILIRTGRKGESALQAGERIANRLAGALHRLPDQRLPEMKQISTAVSQPAYCQIMAGVELGRRVAAAIEQSLRRNVKINSADAARQYCLQTFARLASDARQEEFHIVTLDTKHQPIAAHRITVGTLDSSLVHPREVFRPAIRDAAATILLVHNHPSGDPTPSNEDRQVTRRLEAAAETVGIPVLDHIIVAGDRSLSLRQHEMDETI